MKVETNTETTTTAQTTMGDKQPQKRIGWNSGLAHSELGLRGSTLLAWLLCEANDRGLQLQELAKELGVTYGYIHQLRTGKKPIPGISERVVDACATFLKIPRMAVLVAADIVRMDDIYAAAEFNEPMLKSALKFIQTDPAWGPLMPPAVFEVDRKLQHFLILLYEEATGRTLIPGRINAERLMDAMTAKDVEASKGTIEEIDLHDKLMH